MTKKATNKIKYVGDVGVSATVPVDAGADLVFPHGKGVEVENDELRERLLASPNFEEA